MTTNKLLEIDLHDALIKEITIDVLSKNIIFLIDAYLETQSASRTPLKIRFEKMSSLSNIINFNNLEENAFAGHINYWAPAKSMSEPTYIYLTGGCISIIAEKIAIETI